MNCLRCDGTGKYRNEFGMMEKCESCQRADMTLEKVNAEPDSDEEGYWEKIKEKDDKEKSKEKIREITKRREERSGATTS